MHPGEMQLLEEQRKKASRALARKLAYTAGMQPTNIYRVLEALVKLGQANLRLNGAFLLPRLAKLKLKPVPPKPYRLKTINGKSFACPARPSYTTVVASATKGFTSEFGGIEL